MELRFELEPDQFTRLESSPWLEELRQNAKSEEIVSVYFDTRRRRLREKGISLRVRHTPGKRLQTIKTSSGAGLSRNEWEVEIDSEVPDLSKVKGTALEPLVKRKLERKLMPAFATEVTRLICPAEINGSHVEVAMDRGRIRAGRLVIDINEVEIEPAGQDGRAGKAQVANSGQEVALWDAVLCFIVSEDKGQAQGSH